MQHSELVEAFKQNRKDLDAVLQRMKELRQKLTSGESIVDIPKGTIDKGELIAQHTLSIRDLESSIMRQGMALKNLDTPNPYPESYDPKSPVISPTADGLKM